MVELPDANALYSALEALNLLEGKPPMWWPEYGTFSVVVGAVLTQNSQWTRVEQSLANLEAAGVLNAEAIANTDLDTLMELIRPSGLFKNKAKVLQALSAALLESYGGFETFRDEVSREWLLDRKGIGPETADSILCYACGRDAMVVDAYTSRLLRAFGFEHESYDALQAWCVEGIAGRFESQELPMIYALFHGMIVEYVKRYKKGREVDVGALAPLL
ncbi:3-methyladenine DNA glycosylase [Sulfurimonas sp. HSL-3221]|uniref:3-methyladenine DNA glycosylase n=1 Tax=Sulfurimonadaceae TaxID=2771471 RepID=UPI001E4C9112|nr:3-methyladenine DNA glycosylase [Sulfurimonas sp. HSL-3221]UFS63065.1 3-methyladenine DNA glycosylase [Sulfurimonas sp. HSL-3221]